MTTHTFIKENNLFWRCQLCWITCLRFSV